MRGSFKSSELMRAPTEPRSWRWVMESLRSSRVAEYPCELNMVDTIILDRGRPTARTVPQAEDPGLQTIPEKMNPLNTPPTSRPSRLVDVCRPEEFVFPLLLVPSEMQ